MQPPHPTFEEQEYEALVAEGIGAVKDGNRQAARRLLDKAAGYNKRDARPWLWLSATTDDPQEQRKFLDCAVAADPFNPQARRVLADFLGSLDRSRLMPEGGAAPKPAPSKPVDVGAQVFLCPQCGGRLHFDALSRFLKCESCGATRPVDLSPAGDKAEGLLDTVLPTTPAHFWAQAGHRLACERCGAVVLLPPDQKTVQCPYCGSNELIESKQTAELINPQVIGLMNLDATHAASSVKKWLENGWFTPDDLVKQVNKIHLRPAYYPFWAFDGTLLVPWSCEIQEGQGRTAQWVQTNGVELEMFDDVLVPGLKALDVSLLAKIKPFSIKEAVEFQPEILAGWPALAYDLPLAEASLAAREMVLKRVKDRLPSKAAPGREKRDLRTHATEWGGQTYKHMLLPLWVGSYQYRGKSYSLLVNGQTGKVGGEKPRDDLKVALAAVAAILTLALILAFLFILFR